MLLQILTGAGGDSQKIALKIKEESLELKEPQIFNILGDNITKNVLKAVREFGYWVYLVELGRISDFRGKVRRGGCEEISHF